MITSVTWPLLKPALACATMVYHKFSLWPVTAKHPVPFVTCAPTPTCALRWMRTRDGLSVVKTVVLTTAQEAGVVSPLKLAGCIGSGGVTIASVFDTCIKYAF